MDILIPMESEEQRNGLIGIGTFSWVTRLTKRALRLYDEKGLLRPAKKEITGYRLYSFDQLARGLQLKRLADLGFGIGEMQEIVEIVEDDVDGASCETSCSDALDVRLNEILNRRLDDINAEMERLDSIKGSLLNKTILEVLDLESSEPQIKEVPAQRVVSMREKGVYEVTIPKMMKELFGMLYSPENMRAQVKITGPPIFVCHDKEYKETDADIECAIPVAGNVTPAEGMEITTLEGGKMVSYLHKGRYQDVGPSYQRIFEYIGKNGLEVAGPARELFLNDPKEVPESELLSELQVPIK